MFQPCSKCCWWTYRIRQSPDPENEARSYHPRTSGGTRAGRRWRRACPGAEQRTRGIRHMDRDGPQTANPSFQYAPSVPPGRGSRRTSASPSKRQNGCRRQLPTRVVKSVNKVARSAAMRCSCETLMLFTVWVSVILCVLPPRRPVANAPISSTMLPTDRPGGDPPLMHLA